MPRRLAMLILLVVATSAAAAEWTPELWVDEDTLELRTTDPGADPHWSPVWVAVVEDQLYVRLGRRAAGRIERNTTAPHVGVRIAGREFPRVRAELAPAMADRVARELAEKYWTDILIRFFPHPMTLRLVPDPEGAPMAPDTE
jgi:hypothetical protein